MKKSDKKMASTTGYAPFRLRVTGHLLPVGWLGEEVARPPSISDLASNKLGVHACMLGRELHDAQETKRENTPHRVTWSNHEHVKMWGQLTHRQ